MESMNNDEVQLTEKESNNSTKFSPRKVFIHKRFQVALLIWLAFVIIFGGKFNHFLSVAVHHIYPYTIASEVDDNTDFTLGLKAIFAFYCGYFIAGVPGGFLSYRFPATRIFFWSVVVSCFTNVLFPLCVHNKGAVIFLHVIQGLAEGMLLPSFFGIWKNWSPTREFNLLLPISYSGLFFGILVGSGVSYEMLNHWDIPYYIFGGFSVVWLNLWIWLVYETPLDHPTIKEEELVLFTNLHAISVGSVPWLKFFTSFPVWAIMIGNLCHNYICSFGVEELVLHYLFAAFIALSKHETMNEEVSFWAAIYLFLPYSVIFVLIPLLSYLAFFLINRKTIPVINVRKGFVGFGFFLMFIFWIVEIFFNYIIPFSTVAISFSLVGIFANPLEIAPKYASILVGISNTFAILFGILIPNIVIMTGVQTDVLFITICILGAILSLAGCVFYAIFGSDTRESWAE